jgi:imidazolonepropionase-like amidohydrolase
MRRLLKNGVLIDGNGAAPKNGMAIGVEGNRIVALAPLGEFGSDWLADHVATIDCQGAWVMPGLINVHDHLAMRDIVGPPLAETQAGAGKMMLNAIRNSLTALRRGWTTVRDMAAPDGLALGVRDMINAGHMPGPRVISCGEPICVTGGHAWPLCVEADGPDAVRKAARQQLKEGADFVKVMASHDPYGKPGPQKTIPEMTLAEMKSAFEEAELRGKHSACHVMGTTAIANVLEAGVGVLSHGIYLNDELAERMARQGTYLDPTLSSYGVQTISPKRRRGAQWIEDHTALVEPLKVSMDCAVRAGVKIVVGTDTAGIYSEDIALMRSHGMSAMETLVAATKNGADCMLLGDQFGTIEEGKIADIVVLGSDPLDDPTNIEDVKIVIKDGLPMTPGEIDLNDDALQAAIGA